MSAVAHFECAECHSSIPTSSESCPSCAYPWAAVQGPRANLATTSATDRYARRASLRAAIPSVFRFALAVAFVMVAFELVIEELPGWMAKASTELGEDVVDMAIFEEALGWIRWVELALLGFLALRLVLTVLQVKRLFVRVTDESLVRQWGIVGRHVDEIDLRLVADVASRQSAFERLFGIGHVIVRLDGPGNPRLDLRGLPDPNGLREAIRDAARQA